MIAFKSDEGRVSHAPLYNAGFYSGHIELNTRIFYVAYIGPGYKGQPPSRVKLFLQFVNLLTKEKSVQLI